MRIKLPVIAAVTSATMALSGCAVGDSGSGAAGYAQDVDERIEQIDEWVSLPEVSLASEAPSRGVESLDKPLVVPSDGVTAMNRGLAGGSYAGGIPVAAIAKSADVGLRATVVDIRPAILNTASGEWDPSPNLTASELHDEWGLLAPYTVVAIRIDEVLGARPNAPGFEVGDEVEVWFIGGSKTVKVSKEQALAIGLEGDVDPAAEDKAAAEGSDIEAPEVVGDLIRTLEMAYSVYFEEGDSLIFFGRMVPLPRNSVPPPVDRVLWSLVPQGAGVFVVDVSGRVTDATTQGVVDLAELLDAARSLTTATEPSQPPGRG